MPSTLSNAFSNEMTFRAAGPAKRVRRIAYTAALAISTASCRHAAAEHALGGSPDRGRETIATLGCGVCHTVEGVFGATGSAGPALTGIASRTFIAGRLTNTPENMLRWIRDPQRIEPGVAMPPLAAVDDRAARDIVAYLSTLR